MKNIFRDQIIEAVQDKVLPMKLWQRGLKSECANKKGNIIYINIFSCIVFLLYICFVFECIALDGERKRRKVRVFLCTVHYIWQVSKEVYIKREGRREYINSGY